MQRLKSLVTRCVHEAKGRETPFWQRGFRDHALRSEESVAVAARYILDNPARAVRVDHWSEWQFRGGTLLESITPADAVFL